MEPSSLFLSVYNMYIFLCNALIHKLAFIHLFIHTCISIPTPNTHIQIPPMHNYQALKQAFNLHKGTLKKIKSQIAAASLGEGYSRWECQGWLTLPSQLQFSDVFFPCDLVSKKVLIFDWDGKLFTNIAEHRSRRKALGLSERDLDAQAFIFP